MRGGGRVVPLGAVSGLTFVRADKDGDGDFDPMTSTAWDGDAFAASTGTINWNTVFGVPLNAKAVSIWCAINDETAGAEFRVRATSTGTKWSFHIRTQVANQYNDMFGIINIGAAGTSYYQVVSELDNIFIEVIGWYL